jgi:hypothetical protein
MLEHKPNDTEKVARAEQTLEEIGRRAILLDRIAEIRVRRREAEMDFNFASDMKKFLQIESDVDTKIDEILQGSYSRIPQNQ